MTAAPMTTTALADPRAFEWVRAGDLHIDQRHQRECDPEKVARIANEFDWLRFEALTVVRVDANGVVHYLVTEGQHRGLAVQQIGPDIEVPCMVLPTDAGDTTTQAQIALDIQQGRRSHSAFEQWRLRLTAGHEHEVAADAVLTSLGVRLGKGPSTMTIGAVATVRRIVHGGKYAPEYGAELLGLTLGTIMDAYPTYDHESNVSRWDRAILLAVSIAWHEWPDLDRDRLVRSMRVKPAAQWINVGRGPRDVPPQVAILNGVATEYNRGLRKGRLA